MESRVLAPERAENFEKRVGNWEKMHYKGMIFANFPLHCKGPILRGRLWVAHTVIFKSKSRSGYEDMKDMKNL